MNAVSHDLAAVTPPLEACGIVHDYADRRVLGGIDLQLAPGSVLGLVGRNGAGKSTLIRALLGLLQPSGGAARVFGEPALHLSDATKARLAYVPQRPEALAWLSATQMFAYLARFYPRWDAALAADLLARGCISPDVPLVRLSPGERQRVELVRALASRPDLLVLDEPAATLDPVARRELLRDIAVRAGEHGTTVLFSTHIVSDLERIASEIAFLRDGRLLLHCASDEIHDRYARLWLPAAQARHAPAHCLGRRTHPDGSQTLVVERDAQGQWPPAASLPDVRRDSLALEDLFVEIAG